MVAKMGGLRVRGGSLRISGVSEQRCTRICRRADSSSCRAVDYDVQRNECIIHTSETACDDLVRNTRFNHHRRFACAGEWGGGGGGRHGSCIYIRDHQSLYIVRNTHMCL